MQKAACSSLQRLRYRLKRGREKSGRPPLRGKSGCPPLGFFSKNQMLKMAVRKNILTFSSMIPKKGFFKSDAPKWQSENFLTVSSMVSAGFFEIGCSKKAVRKCSHFFKHGFHKGLLKSDAPSENVLTFSSMVSKHCFLKSDAQKCSPKLSSLFQTWFSKNTKKHTH